MAFGYFGVSGVLDLLLLLLKPESRYYLKK